MSDPNPSKQPIIPDPPPVDPHLLPDTHGDSDVAVFTAVHANFAAHAMHALLAGASHRSDYKELAKRAWDIADAMVEEAASREK